MKIEPKIEVHRLWLVLVYAMVTLFDVGSYARVPDWSNPYVHKLIVGLGVVWFGCAAVYHVVMWIESQRR